MGTCRPHLHVMVDTFFQLLQEVCALGRDPKYIGFKMGAKPDNGEVDSGSVLGQGTGRVAPVSEEPMSDEEEDDEDRFSFTGTTSTAKVITENDKSRDNSKYVLIVEKCLLYFYIINIIN